ncbi:MAG: ECF transporter S component [Gemmatimonadota bacterium]|nr:ECF transporter S component [Gemmatimonadota bacterium]
MRPLALALIPRAVAINLALGAIVATLKLPVYLDSVGTILVGALAGPVAGIVTGIASNCVLGLLSQPFFFAFIPVAMVIGGVAGVAGRMGAFRSIAGAIPTGIVIGILAGSTSVPIVILVFGGATPSGTGIITVILRAMHVPLAMAATVASVGVDIVDKTLCSVLVAVVLTRLPSRLSARFSAPRVARGS